MVPDNTLILHAEGMLVTLHLHLHTLRLVKVLAGNNIATKAVYHLLHQEEVIKKHVVIVAVVVVDGINLYSTVQFHHLPLPPLRLVKVLAGNNIATKAVYHPFHQEEVIRKYAQTVAVMIVDGINLYSTVQFLHQPLISKSMIPMVLFQKLMAVQPL